jgi:GH15 family glucan-1,4-alpha-glucosidase
MNYLPIEDYGLIGNMRTAALVGTNGSIDFLSCPDFDSPTVFAAMLDVGKGGRFQIAPVLEDARHKQLYLPETNILLTRFLSSEGVAEVSDFMPVDEDGDHPACIVRRAKTVRGEVHFRMVCDPRFDYARAEHRVEQHDGQVVFESRGADRTVLRLHTATPVRIVEGSAVAEFSLRHGETAAFVLEQVAGSLDSPCGVGDFVSDSFKTTANFWRDWSRRSQYRGRWRGVVQRSALTLKMLTSTRYGSIVAAPSLHVGSRRLVHALCADPAGVHERGRRVHALDRGTLQRAESRRLSAGHVRHQRASQPRRRGTVPPRGVRRLFPRAHRQRCLRPAAARHLRRADGLGVPVQQAR